jgi:C-terminal processing protease CtpA/Prc
LWTDNGYPDSTLVQQEDLGSDGSVTGYFFEDISTAVLSIPSFSSDIETFSDTIKYFVGNATDKHAKKVIIDLQQNKGGQAALALDAYRYV